MDLPTAEECHRKQVLASLIGRGFDVSSPTALTVCPGCQRERPDVRRRRMNTAYNDEERNWCECCEECFQETVEHFNELWDTYYGR